MTWFPDRCSLALGLVGLLLLAPSVWAQPPIPVPPLPGVELPAFPPPQPALPLPPPEVGPPDVDFIVGVDPPTADPLLTDEEVGDLEAELDAANEEIAAAELRAALPDEWPDLGAIDVLPSIRDVLPFPDRPVAVLLDVFQVTLFKLPPGEALVDIVIGDPLFFETSGEGSEVFVKPMEVPRRTSLLLTTRDGADYSFDLFATPAYAPDVQLRLQTALPQPDPAPRRRPGFNLRFGTLSDLQARRAELAGLRGELARVDAAASREVAGVDAIRESRLTAVRRSYAESIEQRYWLSQDLIDPPLSVSQIWTDGQFTFLRSTAQEAPALYALSPEDRDEPILINYDLTPDGLYIIDHVVTAGWAQVGDTRGEWGLWESPSLDRLRDLELPLRPGPPDLTLPLAVGRQARDTTGFWKRRTGRVVAVAIASLAGYGLWRSVTL